MILVYAYILVSGYLHDMAMNCNSYVANKIFDSLNRLLEVPNE